MIEGSDQQRNNTEERWIDDMHGYEVPYSSVRDAENILVGMVPCGMFISSFVQFWVLVLHERCTV
jgi:hypothetical protein